MVGWFDGLMDRTQYMYMATHSIDHEPTHKSTATQTAVTTNPENEVLWHAWGVAEKRDGNFGVARKLLRKVFFVCVVLCGCRWWGCGRVG